MITKLKNADGKFHKIVTGTIKLIIVAAILLSGISYLNYYDFEYVPIIFGSALALILIILVDYIIAGYFYFIAVDKGYADTVYLKINYFIPPIGQLLVIAMPNLRTSSSHETIQKDELPEI